MMTIQHWLANQPFPAAMRPIIALTVQTVATTTGFEYWSAIRFEEGVEELFRRLDAVVAKGDFYVAAVNRPGQPAEFFVVLFRDQAGLSAMGSIIPGFVEVAA